jgi:DNA-binding response OmpR family regulator
MDRSLKNQVVDNDREVLDTARQALQRVGNAAQIREGGRTAMAALLSDPPDIAILDPMMPVHSDTELHLPVSWERDLPVA